MQTIFNGNPLIKISNEEYKKIRDEDEMENVNPPPMCRQCKNVFFQPFFNEGYFYKANGVTVCIECKLTNDYDCYQKNIANMIAEWVNLPHNIMFAILTYLPNTFYTNINMHLKHCCNCKNLIKNNS